MSIFKYKKINKDGETIEGKAEAKDRFALYHSMKEDGSTVLFVEEENNQAITSFLKKFLVIGGVGTHDKILFARNLSKMLEAGLPITRGLSIMERQAKGKLKNVLQGLNESLTKGETLSDAMKRYQEVFSLLFISMVRAGEESGNLSFALQNVGLQMEKSYQLTKKIRGALMYPAVIFSLMVVIGVLMMVYLVPTLTSTFIGLGVELPLSTRIIIVVSDFLKSYYILVAMGVFVFGFLFMVFLRTKFGKRVADWVLLHTPAVNNIVKQINSARTARTLSSLLSSGVDVLVAISVTKDVLQNSYYKEVLEKTQNTIQKGEQISTVFSANEKLYPLFVGEMIAVGEETGKIGEMLLSVAIFYEDEVDQKTKDMSSIIEPLLMIFIGVAVGIFAVSMLGPTYSLADAI